MLLNRNYFSCIVLKNNGISNPGFVFPEHPVMGLEKK